VAHLGEKITEEEKPAGQETKKSPRLLAQGLDPPLLQMSD